MKSVIYTYINRFGAESVFTAGKCKKDMRELFEKIFPSRLGNI